MDPNPGINLINENPQFIDVLNNNFSYNNSSPCIDAGNPEYFDSDGTVSDIGANVYFSYILGDCNQDNQLNIIDIVYNMNNCILNIDIENCNCSDLNLDNSTNILDIVIIVNIILSD